LFFSVASIGEIVIKRGLGRDDFKVNPRRLRKIKNSCWPFNIVTGDRSLLPAPAQDVTRLHSMDFRHPFGNSIQVITVAL
jgi:hypothetical protein